MRLLCFGDSWTAGHGVETDKKFKEIASPLDAAGIILKLRVMNSWPRWVAEKFDCPYINFGVCGYGNQYILNDITSVKEEGYLEPDDIIIVMLSYPYRYVKDINDVAQVFWKMEKLLKDHKHFYFNSFFPTFKEEEDFDIKNLPNTFIKPEFCVSDMLVEYEKENDVSVWEYGSRKVWEHKSEYDEGGFHPNLLGYRLIGDFIYNEIKDKI
jgi:hypothetical protein